MNAHCLVLIVVTGVAGCTTRENQQPRSDTSSQAARPQSADTPAVSPAATTASWTVTPTGIGPVRVGMGIGELRAVAGEVAAKIDTTAECTYVRPAKLPAGVAVMLSRGHVARIDVDSSGVRSAAGPAVGDSASRVVQAYGDRATSSPHKYVPGGQYLSVRPVSPADSAFRIVFETENGRITRFRSGRVPEVEWVERCG